MALLAWGVTPFLSDMRFWGISWLRFGPPAGWVLWTAAAACLVPAAARPLARAAGRLGDALFSRPLACVAAVGAGLAALVLALPDRTLFVGDALLRRGTLETAARAELLYPQALPLELLLHVDLPRALAAAGMGEAAQGARVEGALLAGLLVAAAVAFVHALGVRGAAAAGALALVVGGGWLGLFTGYAKSFPTLVVLVVAAAAAAVRLARDDRRGGLALGLAIALAVALHRAGLALLPLGALAVIDALTRPTTGTTGRLRPALAITAPIALVLVAVAPRLLSTIGGYDLGSHFAAEDVRRAGGPWRAALAGHRPGDLFNLFTFLTPGAWLVPLLLAATAGRSLATREGVALVALAAPFVFQALVVHPAQGLFRDVDVFAPAGVAVACLAAYLLVRGLGEETRTLRASRAGQDIAFAAAVVVPLALAVIPLGTMADATRGLARAEAFARERPERTAVERAKTWDFLGAAWYRQGRPADAARAFAAAAESSRNPRLYLQQARAARDAGDLAQAQAAYESALAVAPREEAAWLGLGAVAWQRGDARVALRAARALVELAPADSARRAGLAAVEEAIAGRAAITPLR